jgi:hypothetical protein
VKQLEAYLVDATAASTQRSQSREMLTTMTTLLGVVVATGLFFTVFKSIWWSIASFMVWTSVVNGAVRRVFHAQDERRKRENPQQEEANSKVEELNRFRVQGTLAERFHPKVLDVVDRCAGLARAIKAVVDDPLWRQKHAGAEWDKVILQARDAADSTMGGVILSCVGGYRPKGMPRKVWKEQVDADPEAAGTVAALATYEHELQQLAEALGARPNHPTVGSPIGLVLQNLAEIKAAEQELDDLTVGQQ